MWLIQVWRCLEHHFWNSELATEFPLIGLSVSASFKFGRITTPCIGSFHRKNPEDLVWHPKELPSFLGESTRQPSFFWDVFGLESICDFKNRTNSWQDWFSELPVDEIWENFSDVLFFHQLYYRCPSYLFLTPSANYIIVGLGWWFGLLVSPYERGLLLRGYPDSNPQTYNPNQQVIISWHPVVTILLLEWTWERGQESAQGWVWQFGRPSPRDFWEPRRGDV